MSCTQSRPSASTSDPVTEPPAFLIATEETPTNARPTDARPTDALPTDALPTDALPTDALQTDDSFIPRLLNQSAEFSTVASNLAVRIGQAIANGSDAEYITSMIKRWNAASEAANARFNEALRAANVPRT